MKKIKKMTNNDKKFLREISNDDLTPKKRNLEVQKEIYDPILDIEGWDYDDIEGESVPLAEY
jgi:hypothetical protein|tara:strand:- start:251 stop:436 length:186 start_codon:yes stop_codon:yes gene_type:complete